MSKKYKSIALGGLIAGLIVAAAVYFQNHTPAVLAPRGIIAAKERNLILVSTLLMLLVVIPVFIMTAVIAWKYNDKKTSTRYTPDWDHSPVLEFLWWAIPGVIILALAVITWNSSHDLDPFKPIVSNKPPITIQVVALQWKWLFIYPQQNIASLNIVQFPKQTPINFEVTADAPMNSFWIPQLGGQIYAMPGMSTQLHLMADSEGSYRGASANISGRGFASMNFIAKSTSADDFNNWVQLVKQTKNNLSLNAYDSLAKPTQNNPLAYYSSSQEGLYNRIVMKYMVPASQLPYINAHNAHGGGI